MSCHPGRLWPPQMAHQLVSCGSLQKNTSHTKLRSHVTPSTHVDTCMVDMCCQLWKPSHTTGLLKTHRGDVGSIKEFYLTQQTHAENG